MRPSVRRLLRRVVFAVALVASSWGPGASIAFGQQAPSPGAPAGNDSPLYGGNYFNQRYSGLNQITPSNVASLKGVCEFRVDTKSELLPHSSFETSPIEVNGTLYVTGPLDQLSAIDATTCATRWNYTPELLDRELLPLCCAFVNRGVAIGDGKVFIARLDARLVALDQNTGQVVWNVSATGVASDSPSNGYSETMAPQFFKPANANGLVIVGVSGGEYEGRGRVTAFDSATGAIRWGPTFTTNQAVPQFDDPAGNAAQSGGPVWQTPPIDPALGMVYVNVGNPAPDADGSVRPGNNPDSDSLVALDLATGTRKWGYQQVHHDIWDHDSASPPILFDIPGPGGTVVHGLGEASKTGWVYLLDRATGQPLPQFSAPATAVPQEPTQATSPTQPIPNAPAFVPNGRGGTNIADCTPPVVYRGVLLSPEPIFTPFSDGPHLICTGAAGGSEWSPHSFSQQTNAMYVCGVNQGQVYTKEPDETHVQVKQPFLRFGSAFIAPPAAKKFGTLTALDVTTNTIKWQRRGDKDNVFTKECIAGSLATAGGLVFVGEGTGTIDAFDASTRATLWQFQTGAGVNAPPITYSVGGRQYVAVAAGGNSLANTPRPSETIWVFATNGTIGPAAAPVTPAPRAANTDEVEIDAFQFQPSEIHIRPGTTVTWKNGDDVAHTATADRNPADPANPYEFSSPLLESDDSFSHTFTRAGEFPYHCNPHPAMTANVVVDPNAPEGGEIVQLTADEPAIDPNEAADLHAAVESTMDLDGGRSAVRVPSVTIDPAGEASVRFAIRNEGTDPRAVATSALADLKTILETVSQSSDAARITSTTVFGTCPVANEAGQVPESIVLRGVLSAERAAQIDWSSVAPEDLGSVLASLWLHPALTDKAEPGAGATLPEDAEPGLPGQMSVMLGHMNLAVEALSAGDSQGARSQFNQFFDIWDEANQDIDITYPDRFDALDRAVTSAKAAMIEPTKKREAFRQSLLAIRAALSSLADDMGLAR
jgi:quinohemoprotein ethanol dehydrogenase